MNAPHGCLVAAKLAVISRLARLDAPETPPPPEGVTPLGRGVWPRPTGADPTGARDFTPLGRRSGYAR